MRIAKKIVPVLICLVLIFDSSTAMSGAQEAVSLCLNTVVPSLFPLIFFTSLLTSGFGLGKLKIGKILCRVFGIPDGTEMILLSGLLGGYPVGARVVEQAVENGQLTQTAASRMIIFCNACGPSFIFGMVGAVFRQSFLPWLLWGVHILSAWVIARLTFVKRDSSTYCPRAIPLTIPKALRQSIRAVGEICGWIILSRVLLEILNRWCFSRLPQKINIFLGGMIELSNGCVSLRQIASPGLQFLFCSVFISFGGICVALQVYSAAQNVNCKLYIPGKILHGCISFLIAYPLQSVIFRSKGSAALPGAVWLAIFAAAIFSTLFIRKNQKRCGILVSVGV